MGAEDRTKDWRRGGHVLIEYADGTFMERPVAFFFDAPGGVAWVEPQYADPWGAGSSALHVWQGKENRRHFANESGDLEIIERDDELFPSHKQTLDWYFGEYLPGTGRSFEDEKKRVRETIRDAVEGLTENEEGE